MILHAALTGAYPGSSSWGFSLVQCYNSTLPDWQKTPGDRHFIGDVIGDGKANLSLFNSSDWSIAYQELLQSNRSGLSMATRQDGSVPGWQTCTHATHSAADSTGDGKAVLFVYILTRTGRHTTLAG